jgi:hypothetical protein
MTSCRFADTSSEGKLSDQCKGRASDAPERSFHNFTKFRLTRIRSLGEMDFPSRFSAQVR